MVRRCRRELGGVKGCSWAKLGSPKGKYYVKLLLLGVVDEMAS